MMANDRIEHRSVWQWLTEWLNEECRMAMNKMHENTFIRNAVKIFTASILIFTVFVSVGILINRGWICFTK